MTTSGVTGTIDRARPRRLCPAAARDQRSGADAVWLQHEYGIFGGDDGEMVCDFVDASPRR